MSRWHRTVDAGDVTLYGYVVGVDVLQMDLLFDLSVSQILLPVIL